MTWSFASKDSPNLVTVGEQVVILCKVLARAWIFKSAVKKVIQLGLADSEFGRKQRSDPKRCYDVLCRDKDVVEFFRDAVNGARSIQQFEAIYKDAEADGLYRSTQKK